MQFFPRNLRPRQQRDRTAIGVFTTLTLVIVVSLFTGTLAPSSAEATEVRLLSVSGSVHGGTATGPAVTGSRVTLTVFCQEYDWPAVTVYSMQQVTGPGGSFDFQHDPGDTDSCGLSAEPAFRIEVSSSPDLVYTGVSYQGGSLPVAPRTLTLVVPLAGTIAGRVTAKKTGAALEKITVTAKGVVTKSTVTSPDGTYTLPGLAPGVYALTATDPAFNPVAQLAIPLSGGQTVPNANVSLTKLSSFRGTVTTGTSPAVAVAGITVTGFGVTTTTDASGRYSLGLVTSGRQSQIVLSDATQRYATLTRMSPMAAGDSDFTVDASLVLTGGLGGTVTRNDLPGIPLQNAIVQISSVPTGRAGAIVSTDAAGAFSVVGLSPGGYSVTFGSGGFLSQSRSVTVTSGSQLDHIDARMDTALTVSRLSGTVRLSSLAGVSGTVVDLTRVDGLAAFTGTTNASGGYAFLTVPAGQYRISYTPSNTIYPKQWFGDVLTEAAAKIITVAPSAVLTGLDATLRSIPVYTLAPTPNVGGEPSTGTVLSAAVGTWAPIPDRFSYSWQRGGVAIVGAAGTTYTLTAADAGSTITVSVRAAKVGYADLTRTSAATAVITRAFDIPPTPVISGTTTVGKTLTVAAGTWSPVPASFGYRWLRDGVVIPGATAQTYILASVDANARITVTVTANLTGYTVTTRSSVATAKVLRPFVLVTKPAITGIFEVGATLAAATGTWTPVPSGASYQWLRSGLPITGATSRLYVLTPADAGSTVTVVISVTSSGYVPASQAASPAKTVLSTLTGSPVPQIFGQTMVGSMLFVATPAWSPAPVGLTFTWQRNGVVIGGATGTAYTLVAADRGARISVSVTGTSTGYASRMQTSVSTRAVTG